MDSRLQPSSECLFNLQYGTRCKQMKLCNAGEIKRWNHHRGPMSHGSKSHRLHGSTGASATPNRTFPGQKMSGHMGDKRIKCRKLKVGFLCFKSTHHVILVCGTQLISFSHLLRSFFSRCTRLKPRLCIIFLMACLILCWFSHKSSSCRAACNTFRCISCQSQAPVSGWALGTEPFSDIGKQRWCLNLQHRVCAELPSHANWSNQMQLPIHVHLHLAMLMIGIAIIP